MICIKSSKKDARNFCQHRCYSGKNENRMKIKNSDSESTIWHRFSDNFLLKCESESINKWKKSNWNGSSFFAYNDINENKKSNEKIVDIISLWKKREKKSIDSKSNVSLKFRKMIAFVCVYVCSIAIILMVKLRHFFVIIITFRPMTLPSIIINKYTICSI